MADTSLSVNTLDLTNSSPADGAEFAAPIISYSESGVERELSGVSNEASSRGRSTSSSSSSSSSSSGRSTSQDSTRNRRRRLAAAKAAAKGKTRNPRGNKGGSRSTRGPSGRSETARRTRSEPRPSDSDVRPSDADPLCDRSRESQRGRRRTERPQPTSRSASARDTEAETRIAADRRNKGESHDTHQSVGRGSASSGQNAEATAQAPEAKRHGAARLVWRRLHDYEERLQTDRNRH